MVNLKLVSSGIIMIILLNAGPVFATDTQTVQVTISNAISITAFWNGGANNNTINLGSLAADNIQRTFPGGASGEQIRTYSNTAIDVYTRAAGNLQSGSNSIALTNFQYSGGTISLPTSFTVNYFKMYDNWASAPQGGSNTAPVNLYMTVPYGTSPGTYTTTIYFSAVAHGASPPTSP